MVARVLHRRVPQRSSQSSEGLPKKKQVIAKIGIAFSVTGNVRDYVAAE